MIDSISKCVKSFGFAIKGLTFVLKNENNIRYQLFAGALATSLGYYLGISTVEWTIITLMIGLVLMAETFNTAIEKLVDHVSPEIHPAAGLVKDISAAAVLIISIATAIIAYIIFYEKLLSTI